MRIQNCVKMALPVTFITAGNKRSTMLMPGQAMEVDQVVGPAITGLKVTPSDKAAKPAANTTPTVPLAASADAAKPAA